MLGLYEKREKQNKTERDPRASGPASLHHQATKIVNRNFFILFLNLAVKYDLGLSILARLVLISYLSSNLFCFQYLCLIWFCKGKIQSPKKKKNPKSLFMDEEPRDVTLDQSSNIKFNV